MTVVSRLMSRGVRPERRSSADLPGPLETFGDAATYGAPTEDRAMRHSAVWAATDLRSGLMSTFPAHSYRQVGEGRERVSPTPRILREPKQGPAGDGMLMGEFAAMAEVSLMLRGNFYALITRDFATRPTELVALHPDQVRVTVADGKVQYRVDGKKVDSTLMWHRRRHVMPGSPVGMSAISYARVSIEMGLMAERFGADFFRDSAHPTGLIKAKGNIGPADAEIAKQRWMKALNGRREPVVLGGDWDYQAIQISPEDSQFLDAIGANVGTIARFMSVPVELLGAAVSSGGSLTYANLADRALHLLVFYLQPAIEAWEDGLTEVLPGGRASGMFAKLSTDAVLRLDPKTQAEVNGLRLRNGETNPDELRALRDLPPLPNGQGQQFIWPPTSTQLTTPPKETP